MAIRSRKPVREIKPPLRAGAFVVPALFLVLIVVVADQFTKWWIMERLFRSDGTSTLPLLEWLTSVKGSDYNPTERYYTPVALTTFLNIIMVWNKGISFGMFQNDSDLGVYMLISLALAISIVFIAWLALTNSRATAYGLALIVGGALGNVIDRFRMGAVADFLDFHYGNWHFPAFNLADSCITIGAALILLSSFLNRQKDDKGYLN